MEMKTGRWSESEVEKLNVMQDCGFSIETMSMLLDRPKTSVYGKIWHMKKQNEITSFNVEDLPPKYDPNANKPDPSEMIINVPVHELDDPIIEVTQADRIEEVAEAINHRIDNVLGWVATLTLANGLFAGLVAWTILS
jgi:hypothetical protein